MNSRQFRMFLTVAESKSLTKAAEALFLSKQSLKSQIDILESNLGCSLLDRNHSGCALTPAGEIFYEYSKDIVKREAELLKRLREVSEYRDTITILNPPHPRLLLEKAFAEFARRYPIINQNIIYKENRFLPEDVHNREPYVTEPSMKIRSGVADIADYIHHNAAPIPEDMDFFKIRTQVYYCIMSPDNPLAGQKSLTLDQLEGKKLHITRGQPTNLLREVYRRFPDYELHSAGFDQTPKIFSACSNGDVWLSKAYFSQFLQPLVAVPLEENCETEEGILYMKVHSPVVDMFVEVVKELYGEGV